MANQAHTHVDPTTPNPARTYERAKPEAESGMGRPDNNQGTPTDAPDRLPDAVANARDTSARPAGENRPPVSVRQIPIQPDHSMLDEEPDGWDLAPQDIHDPRQKRHPRKEGKGGMR